MKKSHPNSRYDAFIIWGHGLANRDAILDRLRSNPTLKIIRIDSYKPKNLPSFVRSVYADTGVPYEHLEAKTAYLMNTMPEILVVTAINLKPREEIVGEGRFRHVQCLNVQAIKESIRDEFNPRIDGKRTEEHVIHSSDTEEETDSLLRLIDLEGLEQLENQPNAILNAPYHLPRFSSFKIKLIPLSQLRARILQKTPDKARITLTMLEKTPHYLFLKGKPKAYKKYLNDFGGLLLTDDHYPEKFESLAKNMIYLGKGHELDYILVKQSPDGIWEILDGLHRAAILARREVKEVVVAEIAESESLI